MFLLCVVTFCATQFNLKFIVKFDKNYLMKCFPFATGLKTGLIEADDFAAGTSSRSTKLIHGGVRYLQKAILNFDAEQYNMVKEALRERSNMLEIAPHLTKPLPIMLPVYK